MHVCGLSMVIYEQNSIKNITSQNTFILHSITVMNDIIKTGYKVGTLPLFQTAILSKREPPNKNLIFVLLLG